MNWSLLRGTAINNTTPPERDLNLIDYKIIIIINDELSKYQNKIKLKDNKYGTWVIK